MVRKLFSLAVAVAFFAGSLTGAEYKGKLVKVDAEKNTITVAVGAAKKKEKPEEKTFNVAKDAKVVSVKAGKKGQPAEETTLSDGLKNAAFAGAPAVTIVTDGAGEKEVVKEVKVTAGAKKKK